MSDNIIDNAEIIPEPKKRGRRERKLTKKARKIIRDQMLGGATESDCRLILHVNCNIWYRWKKQYPDFFEEVNELKYKADEPVVSALRRNATGFKYEEKHYEIIEEVNEAGQIEPVKKLVKVIEKYSLPETAACMCWLNNRHPDKWRHRQYIDSKSKVETNQILQLPDLTSMTEEEAKKQYEQMLLQEKQKKE